MLLKSALFSATPWCVIHGTLWTEVVAVKTTIYLDMLLWFALQNFPAVQPFPHPVATGKARVDQV